MINKPTPVDSASVNPTETLPKVAPDWSQREHVSDQINLEAAKLLELAGSEGIAILALTVVAEVAERERTESEERNRDKEGKSNS